MSAASGHDAAESGVSQGPSRIQAIRVLAAKTLRWGANKLDPPKPGTPYQTDWDSTANGWTGTNSTDDRYRLYRR